MGKLVSDTKLGPAAGDGGRSTLAPTNEEKSVPRPELIF
jgi:hypothetical protein